jgi:hypothetical protein
MNLSKGDRRFFNTLLETRGMEILDSEDGGGAHAIAHFFALVFPDSPVLRIRIPPGCAYCTMTDYLIHDGMNEHRRTPDVHLHLRANLRPWFDNQHKSLGVLRGVNDV